MKMPTGVTSRALGFLSVVPAIFHLLAIEARHAFFFKPPLRSSSVGQIAHLGRGKCHG
jgi:hypothetical protein